MLDDEKVTCHTGHLRSFCFADNVEKDSLKENKKPMNITSVTDAIESVVKQTVEADYNSDQNKQSSLDMNKKSDLAVPKSSMHLIFYFQY